MEHIPLVNLKVQFASIKEEIYEAIERVLEKQCFIMGDEVNLFEKEFADFCNAKYCVGLSSGTAALHLALIACGIGPGDEVITVPYTFISTTEAISYVGGKIVFVDIEPTTYTINVEKLEQAITDRTKAIIPVHLYGHPANMSRIMEIAKKYNLKVIEDAAQAHGAMLNGQPVGTFGDVGCFSFFPAKNLGAYGDAGAIITNNNNITEHINLLRNHGRSEKYEHRIEGFNHRLDALQAAILRVKLKYLKEWTYARRKQAMYYGELLKDLPLSMPSESPGYYHVYHLYVVRTQERDALRAALKEEGIETGIHYPVPLHLQPAYFHLDYSKGDFPIAEACACSVISLPLYPELSKKDQNKIVKVIQKFITEPVKMATVGGVTS